MTCTVTVTNFVYTMRGKVAYKEEIDNTQKIGDWIGRILAGIGQIVSEKSRWLLILSISRVVFIPLFLMCNYEHRLLPYVFNHDFWPIIINVLFSVSNGYLGSLGMMYGPKMFLSNMGRLLGQ